MKKFLLALAIGIAPLSSLFAQSNDSTRFEIGLQSMALPVLDPPSIGDIFYNAGGSKARSTTASLGVDARFRMSPNVKLRIGLGVGQRKSVSETSEDRRPVDGALNTWTQKSLSQMVFAQAGLGYEHQLGRIGLAAGPELSYYQWLPVTSTNTSTQESDGPVGYVVRVDENKYSWSRAHHVGLGFFLGANFRVCKGLVVSGELHQGYAYSIWNGSYDHSLSTTTTINQNPAQTITTTNSSKSNSRRGAFLYPLPSLAVRYCW